MDLIIMASKGEMNLNNKKAQNKLITCCKNFVPVLIKGVIQLIKASKRTPAPVTTTTTTATTTETHPTPEEPGTIEIPENNERV